MDTLLEPTKHSPAQGHLSLMDGNARIQCNICTPCHFHVVRTGATLDVSVLRLPDHHLAAEGKCPNLRLRQKQSTDVSGTIPHRPGARTEKWV